MRLDPNHTLSPQTLAAIRELIHETPRPEIGDEELIAFVRKTVTEERRKEIVSVLVASTSLRRRVAELYAAHQAAELLGASQQLSKGIAEALGVDGSLDRWDAAPDWATLLEPHAETDSVRSAFTAIGEGLDLVLKTPRLASLRRGGGGATTGLPPGVEASVFAEIDDDGALNFEAVFNVDPDSEDIDGHKIRLELLDPAGGSIPIGTSAVEGRSIRLALPNFGSIVGLEAGSLPDGVFRMVFEGEEPGDAAPGYLIAETESDRIILNLLAPPTWKNGVLSVTLAIPRFSADRFAGGVLHLFAEAEETEFPLASRPLSDFAEGEQEIRISVDGSGSDRQICGSLIRARIVSPR